MEAGSRAASHPAAASEDTGVLTIVEDDFVSVYDVPFITMNKVGGQYQAEVIMSLDDSTSEARIQEALDVGHVHGVHAYARILGEYNNVLIFFTPDTDGGV